MLLLPLLILWARNPMNFPRYLMRPLASLVATIAVAVPVVSDQIAWGAEYDSPENRMRSERHLVSDRDDANPMRPEKMREGTLVPPTVGRFIPAGRRWMFVPDSVSDETDDIARSQTRPRPIPRNVFRSVSSHFDAPKTSQKMYSGSIRVHERNRLREYSASDRETDAPTRLVQTSDAAIAKSAAGNPIGLPKIIAAENLMLQRIVDAIRTDGVDDRWTVSGQLTEFFDENRLLLRTAERAASQ